jgi:hypothetical protein
MASIGEITPFLKREWNGSQARFLPLLAFCSSMPVEISNASSTCTPGT